jgi:hypothetical protein
LVTTAGRPTRINEWPNNDTNPIHR